MNMTDLDRAIRGGLIQQDRLIRTDIPSLPANAMVPRRAVTYAELGRDFSVSLDMVSPLADVELKTLIAQPMTLWIRQKDMSYLPLNGYIHTACRLGSEGSTTSYQLTFASWMHFLKFGDIFLPDASGNISLVFPEGARQGESEMQIKPGAALATMVLMIYSTAGFSFDHTSVNSKPVRLAVQMGGGCAVSIEDLYHGHFESGMSLHATYWTDKPPVTTKVSDFSVNMVCEDVTGKSFDNIAAKYGATYDKTKIKWHAYYIDEQDKALLSPTTHIYDIKSINGSGFARTTDDVVGDSDQRVRSLSYCVFNGNSAVCGNEKVMKLSDPKGNLLPFVMEVLRSIEFQDVNTHSGRSSTPTTAIAPKRD